MHKEEVNVAGVVDKEGFVTRWHHVASLFI